MNPTHDHLEMALLEANGITGQFMHNGDTLPW
jgi:hypothetical protein